MARSCLLLKRPSLAPDQVGCTICCHSFTVIPLTGHVPALLKPTKEMKTGCVAKRCILIDRTQSMVTFGNVSWMSTHSTGLLL